MNTPIRAFVGLGSNLGDSIATLHAAIDALSRLPGTRLSRASRLYRSPAWGHTDQADFVNAVALLDTELAPRALLDGMLAIERAFGRERRERWGPRILDLDLLLYGDSIVVQPGLQVPHPHLHERAFALVPLVEVDPDAVIPGLGPARDVLSALACGPIEAVG